MYFVLDFLLCLAVRCYLGLLGNNKSVPHRISILKEEKIVNVATAGRQITRWYILNWPFHLFEGWWFYWRIISLSLFTRMKLLCKDLVNGHSLDGQRTSQIRVMKVLGQSPSIQASPCEANFPDWLNTEGFCYQKLSCWERENVNSLTFSFRTEFLCSINLLYDLRKKKLGNPKF